MASSTPSRTRRSRGGKQNDAAPAAATPETPEAPAPEAPAADAPKVRAAAGSNPKVGLVGMPGDNEHPKAVALRDAARKLRPKEKWEFASSVQGEMLLQRNDATAAYLIVNKADELTARYSQRKTTSFPQTGLNLKRVGDSGGLTFKQAAETIVKHNDEWVAEKGSRRSKTATAATEAPAATDGGGEGDNLQADLDASVKQATEPQKQTRQRQTGVNPVASKSRGRSRRQRKSS